MIILSPCLTMHQDRAESVEKVFTRLQERWVVLGFEHTLDMHEVILSAAFVDGLKDHFERSSIS